MLAQVVMDAAAALCNDTVKERYSYVVQVPYLQQAIDKVTNDLINAQVSNLKEESAILSFPAGSTLINEVSVPALPVDFLEPIMVEERRSGTTDTFVELDEAEWEPEEQQQETLRVYSYREGEYKFVGATTNRDLKISYYKTLAIITSEVSIIPGRTLAAPLGFLQAAYLSRYIGENYQRYNDLMRDYRDSWDAYIQIQIKRNQANPTRRPGYRESARNC